MKRICRNTAFLFILALLTAVSGWGACVRSVADLYCGGGSASCTGCPSGSPNWRNYQAHFSTSGKGTQCSAAGTVTLSCNGSTGHVAIDSAKYVRSCSGSDYSARATFYGWVCENECEADSVRYYSDCIAQGNVWNSDSCKCEEAAKDTTITYCINIMMQSLTEVVGVSGLVYQQITKQPAHEMRTCHCKVRNGTITECEGKTSLDVNADCPVTERTLGTCNDNGKPDGPQPDNGGGGGSTNGWPSTAPPSCYAVTGSTCHITAPGYNMSWSCECDGSCNYAMNQIAQGEGECFRPPPSSSSYSPFSSASSSPSSSASSSPSSSESSSASSSGSGGGENGMYMEVLQAIQANTYGTMQNTYDISQWTQTTMNNTTDIKNELSNVAIDVSYIRDNTLQTANNTGTIANNTGTIASNTGSIDSKLSATNNLLNDIKNKNWNPNVNVNVERDTNIINVAGDTNIINVSVEGGVSDTSRAPAEILSILRQREGSDSDTAGTGATLDGLKDSLVSKISGDTVPNMRDSIPGAVEGVRINLRALRDTIQNSAYGDSLAKWQNQLLNNGVLSGSGSDNCPSVFRRSFQWNMGSTLGTWNLGSLRYICDPIANTNVTFWQLARMVLRAMVAISCMLWIYRAVTGTDGGFNDED